MDEDKARQSERRRNLEILRYGHAVRINHKGDDAGVTPSHSKARLADDAILTGLCKLVAIQLRCRNAFICLSDSSRQHIIAESTQTLSPYDQAVHAPGDGLLFGVQSMYHAYGITQITLPSYVGESRNFISNKHTSVSDERSIFLDLHQEPALNEVPFTNANRQYRFYVEAPLRNASGIVIGIVAALDEKPRLAFEEIDIRSMLDVARMSVEHLELLRMRDAHAYAERLMQGLGYFNVGRSSLGEDDQDHSANALSVGGTEIDSQEMVRPLMLPRPEAMQSHDLSISSRTPSIQTEQSFSTINPGSTQTSEIGPTRSRIAIEETPTGPDYNNPATDTSPDLNNTQSRIPPAALDATLSINKALSRAANLIREAMDLKAACFLDLLPGLNSNPKSHSKHLNFSLNGCDISESATTTDMSDASAFATSESDGKDDAEAKPEYCKPIAFSSKQSSDLAGDKENRIPTHISRKFMQTLLSMYPKGHVFQFDSLGLLSSGDDSDPSRKSHGLRSRRHKMAQMLSESFNGARSLIFLPLYDYERQRQHCAFFGWIADPVRVLSDTDITYVSGFANSIMCEVMRLEVLSIERAKTVFISSISHELRSPLHGILAATELLQESNITDDQNEFALMVSSCGRTLLDIINNLLEYANINNKLDRKSGKLQRNEKRHRRIREKPKKKQVHESSLTAVNIVEITEETVMSVVTGHSLINRRSEQGPSVSARPSDTTRDVEVEEARTPTVVLDFRQQDNWCFGIDAGAWRRIVMNLVGNALKYTASGHVVIGMYVKGPANGSRQKSHLLVLTVSDSGRGMSGSYMKDKLYTPFAQEDRLSVGVGLGLSIVHRLVAELGGKININSEVDVGTEVLLSIPLAPYVPPPSSSALPIQDPIGALQREPKKDKLVYFAGFDILPALDQPPTGTMGSRALGLLKLKQALSSMVAEWFGMTVTSDVKEASLCFLEAEYGQSLLQEHPEHHVFTMRYFVVHVYNQDEKSGVHWPGLNTTITTPIGPSKLARQLLLLLQLQSGQTRNTAGSTTSISQPPAIEAVVENNTTSADCAQLDSVPALQSTQKHHRILLVDDNEINLRILATLVQKLDFPFDLAKNGQEALDRFVAAHEQRQPFKHVFMDISMPIMDGITSTKLIRAYEKEQVDSSPAQIFALTGLGDPSTQSKAFDSGINHYFRKPVKLKDLREVLISTG